MRNNTVLDLSQFKAPGIYFVEFDSSEYTTINTNILRLVVGFSKKGPINTLTLLETPNEAISIYGNIDYQLEKRGSFFHRSLLTCLETAPVLALNLMPLNNGQSEAHPIDRVQYKSLSIDTSSKNSKVANNLLSSFYNKESFWKLSSSNFDAIVNQNGASIGKLFSVANIGDKTASILVRKSSVRGFDITALDFFGSGNVPSYMKDFDIMNDYFIEVIVVEGDWNDYNKLSNDPVYSQYFDLNGVIKSNLNDFLALPNVNLLGVFNGSIIPDLVDGNGYNHSIDTILNQNITQTGLFASLNRDVLNDYDNKTSTDSDLDMVGHKIAQNFGEATEIKIIDFLSYTKSLETSKSYSTAITANTLANTLSSVSLTDVKVKSTYTTTDKGILNNIIKIKKPLSSNVSATLTYNSFLSGVKSGEAIVPGYELKSISANVAYFGVSDYIEKDEKDESNIDSTYLYLTVRNKNKLNEVNLSHSFIESNLGGNSITVTSYGKYGAPVGSDVYFKAKTTAPIGTNSFYAKVGSLTRDIGNTQLSLTFSGLSANLSTLGLSNTTHDIIISDYYALQIANSSTLNYNLSYSSSPNHIANVSSTLYSYAGASLYDDYVLKTLQNGQQTTGNDFIKFEKIEDIDGIPVIKTSFYTANTLSTSASTASPANDGTFTVTLGNENIIKKIAIVSGSLSSNQKTVKLSSSNEANVAVGDYLVTNILESGNYKKYLTKVISKIKNTDGTATITTNNDIYILNDGADNILRYKNIESFISNYNFHTITGFNIGEYHMPGTNLTKASQLEKILNVVTPGSNLYNALADNDTIRFRYIVDTFDGGLSNESYPKNKLTKLAKTKGRCLAIMNAPSIEEFRKSNDPRFTDTPSPSTGNPAPPLDVKYIKDGGNLSLGPSVRYSLPSEENGSKYAGFFISYPLVRENRRTFAVPPASGISNRFVSKHFDGTKYKVVAGKYGTFSIPNSTGTLEYNFNATDRGNLAEIGLNPIVYKPTFGYTIYDDLMAYQKTRSAFNNLSIRDVLITIEDGLDDILTGYLFEPNNETMREEIASRVRKFLSDIQTNGGITAYKVTMNDKNNTNETIQSGFGIINIEIEPTFSIKKFVNAINVVGAGALSQTGF